ncbi:MAG: HAD-IC family P-type ATPase [Candidatus Kerfeldbacteria bacterium]
MNKERSIQPPATVQWHSMTVEQTLQKLQVSLSGLRTETVPERRKLFGRNDLPQQRRRSSIVILLNQFRSPLVLVLFAAAAISFWFRAAADGWIILFIIAFNGIVGFYQERRAGHAMERLQSLTPQHVHVLRDGEEQEILADQLVVGDIVKLEVGSIVPADGRIVESVNMKINEAVFTGESVPAQKHCDPLPESTELTDRRNCAWRGTTIAGGRGILVVAAVGTATRFGEIVREVADIGTQETPFQKKIGEFARRLAFVIVILSLGVFIVSVMRGIHFERALLLGVSLVVSLIPEGLPVVITLTFAWGMWEMAKRRALIRKLYAVETLGSVTVIATDKTGTLTFGEMMVERIVIDGRTISVTGEGYRKSGDFFESEKRIAPIEDPVLKRLLEIGILNNDSRITHDEKGRERWIGDPTETCLIVLGEKAGFRHADLDLAFPRVGEFPFDFSLKYMVTFHTTPEGKTLIAVKGAPRQILQLCTRKMVPHGIEAFTDRDREEIRNEFEAMAATSLRGLAFAYAEVEGKWELITHQNLHEHLVYLGLVGIRDTIRPEARETVSSARAAGIQVVMLTGDYHETAINVAKEIGLLGQNEHEERVLDGKNIDALNDEQLRMRLRQTVVYSRVSPEQKLRIAQQFKASGEIIAMTGDGINDVPALSEANIGVAIGVTSTDAAKEAAEMVITDGNLSSIVSAIEEGRAIFRNIQRVLIFLLASNFGELILICLAIFLGFPLPLLPIHIMWLNVITDPFLGIALAREPKGPEIMREPPRPPKMPVIDKARWGRIALNGITIGFVSFIVFIIMLARNRPEQELYAVTLTAVALGEWTVAYTSRSSRRSTFSRFFANKFIVPVTIVVIAMQVSILSVPSLSTAFHLDRIGLIDWLLAGSVAVAVLIVEEIRKMVSRRKPHYRTVV